MTTIRGLRLRSEPRKGFACAHVSHENTLGAARGGSSRIVVTGQRAEGL